MSSECSLAELMSASKKLNRVATLKSLIERYGEFKNIPKNLEWTNEYGPLSDSDYKAICRGSAKNADRWKRSNMPLSMRALIVASEFVENVYNGGNYACSPDADCTGHIVITEDGEEHLVMMGESRPAMSHFENAVQCLLPNAGDRDTPGSTGYYQNGMGASESNLVTGGSDEHGRAMLSLKNKILTGDSKKDYEEFFNLRKNWNIAYESKNGGMDQLVVSMLVDMDKLDGKEPYYTDKFGNIHSVQMENEIIGKYEEVFRILKNHKRVQSNPEGFEDIPRYEDYNFLSKTVMRISRVYNPKKVKVLDRAVLNTLGFLTDLETSIVENGKKVQKRIRFFFNPISYSRKYDVSQGGVLDKGYTKDGYTEIRSNHSSQPYSENRMMNPSEYGNVDDESALFKSGSFKFEIKDMIVQKEKAQKSYKNEDDIDMEDAIARDEVRMDMTVEIFEKNSEEFRKYSRETSRLCNGGKITIPVRGGRYRNAACYLLSNNDANRFVRDVLGANVAFTKEGQIRFETDYVKMVNGKETTYKDNCVWFVRISINKIIKWDCRISKFKNNWDYIETSSDFYVDEMYAEKKINPFLEKISEYLCDSTQKELAEERSRLMAHAIEHYMKPKNDQFKPIQGYVIKSQKKEYRWYSAKNCEEIKGGHIAPLKNKSNKVYVYLRNSYRNEDVKETLLGHWIRTKNYDPSFSFPEIFKLPIRQLGVLEQSELIRNNKIHPDCQKYTVYEVIIPTYFKVINYKECWDNIRINGKSVKIDPLVEVVSFEEYEENAGSPEYFPKRNYSFIKEDNVIVNFPFLKVPVKSKNGAEPKDNGDTSDDRNNEDEKGQGIDNYHCPFEEGIESEMFAKLDGDRVIYNENNPTQFLWTRSFRENQDVENEITNFYCGIEGSWSDIKKYNFSLRSPHPSANFKIEEKDEEYKFDVSSDILMNCHLNYHCGNALRQLASRFSNGVFKKHVSTDQIKAILAESNRLLTDFKAM